MTDAVPRIGHEIFVSSRYERQGGRDLFFIGGRPPALLDYAAEAVGDRFCGPHSTVCLRLEAGGGAQRVGRAPPGPMQFDLGGALAFRPFRGPLASTLTADTLAIEGWKHAVRPYLEVDAELRLSGEPASHRVAARLVSLVGYSASAYPVRRAFDGREPAWAVGAPNGGIDVRLAELGLVSERGLDALGTSLEGVTLELLAMRGRGEIVSGVVPITLAGRISVGQITWGAVELGPRAVGSSGASDVAVAPLQAAAGLGMQLAHLSLDLSGTFAVEVVGDFRSEGPGSRQVARTSLGGRADLSWAFESGTLGLYAGVERAHVGGAVVVAGNRAVDLGSEESLRVSAGLMARTP